MIEVNVDLLAADAGIPDEEAIAAGAPPYVHMQIITGHTLPFAQPGTNVPLKVPSMGVSFEMTKEAAIKWANLIIENANQLPDAKPASDIVTATSLTGIEKIAQAHQGLTGKV